MNNFYNHNSKIAKGCCTVPSNKHTTAKKEITGCHKNQCSDNKKGLLTEFDFNGFHFNQTPNLEDPNLTLIPVTNTDICIDDKCDRVLLNAAINWAPLGTITSPGVPLIAIEVVTPFNTLFQVRFTLWRGDPFNPSERGAKAICSYIDTAPFAILQLAVVDINPAIPDVQPALAITGTFGAVTTDFKCVDHNPKCGEVEYFLTMDVVSSVGEVLLNNATAATLTAMEIKKNDDDCC
ncbi:hypothetical protein [Peribacillus frigoritolerans]|uniref:hypothetical protein n=1 Tax=Peribacillus frigoritolerans TaxID=450367 RepID=UPI0025A0D2B8|nr:hypothetical protein [Peribacillus frigoritolerans]MDM5306324.1 hypothetical protein [Peribacillus frigoritolerans]